MPSVEGVPARRAALQMLDAVLRKKGLFEAEQLVNDLKDLGRRVSRAKYAASGSSLSYSLAPYPAPRYGTVTRTCVSGTPRPWPDVEHNDWPSDHAAVITTFSLRE